MGILEGRLDWAVSGDELRIGWNSLLPVEFDAGEDLVSIRLRTTAEFCQGGEIRFTLTPDPMNELADGMHSVKLDALPLQTGGCIKSLIPRKERKDFAKSAKYK
jgi:hypothetical protein